MADEYIRKADAKDALQEKVFHNLTDEFYGAMQAIDELEPAADVVPVVRCRDCKHLGTFRGKLYCRHNCGIVEPKENDFCSRGERKE